MTGWLVLVESTTTGTGRRFAAAACARGVRPVLLTRDPSRYKWVTSDDVHAVVTDTTNEEAVRDTCRRLAADGGLAGITSSSEYFIEIAAATAAALGLPGPDPSAVATTRDKGAQRRALAAAGVAIPRFREAASPAAAVVAATELGLPVVIKPVAESGSRGVRSCTTTAEVRWWTENLLTEFSRILEEEHVDGPEFSVETLDGDVLGIVAKHLGPPPHFVEVGHDFPVHDANLARTTGDALKALGLGWGPAHTELRLTSDGPVVIEVNPRLAGGMIPVAIDLATGIDLVDAVVARICGQFPALVAAREERAAIRFAVVQREGTITALRGLDDARRVPGVALAEFTAVLGVKVRRTHSFADRVGFVIAVGPHAIAAADKAVSCLTIDVDRSQ